MVNEMIIFLDFDGVLHPIHARDQGHFCWMENLLDVLDDFPDIQVVISSSWRHVMDFGVIKSMLGLHGYKVIGVTRDILKPEDGYWRFHEIQGWLMDHEYQGKWLAIDDAEHEFPPEHPNLFLCDSSIGLDDDMSEALRQRLRGLMR